MTEKEFTQLIGDSRGMVLSAIRKYLPADLMHQIDDVAQETYIRVYRGISQALFSSVNERNNWIYTIAKNESIRAADRHRSESVKLKRAAENFSEISSGAESSPRGDDEIQALRKVISGLPDKYRALYEFRAAGFSDPEIAEKMNISRGTVKSRFSRGREIINRIFSAEGIK